MESMFEDLAAHYKTLLEQTSSQLTSKAITDKETKLALSVIQNNLNTLQDTFTAADLKKKISEKPEELQKIEPILQEILNLKKDTEELAPILAAAQRCKEAISTIKQASSPNKLTAFFESAKGTANQLAGRFLGTAKKVVEEMRDTLRHTGTTATEMVQEEALKTIAGSPGKILRSLLSSGIQIREEEEQKLNITITELEKRLMSQEETISSLKGLASELSQFLVKNIVDIHGIPIEHRQSIFSYLFEDITQPVPSPNWIGTPVTILLEDHAEFVEKVLYANMLNIINNAYNKVGEIEKNHPHLLFDLLYKGLDAIHNTPMGMSASEIAQTRRPTQEVFSSIVKEVLIPIFLPDQIDSFIIPDIFANIPGKEYIKEELYTHAKNFFETQLPQLFGNQIVKIADNKETKTRLLTEIYNRVNEQFEKFCKPPESRITQTKQEDPESHKSPKVRRKVVVPESTKKSCTDAISACLEDIATGSDRTSRFIRTFSPQLAKQAYALLEEMLSNTSVLELVEKGVCIVSEQTRRQLSQQGVMAPTSHLIVETPSTVIELQEVSSAEILSTVSEQEPLQEEEVSASSLGEESSVIESQEAASADILSTVSEEEPVSLPQSEIKLQQCKEQLESNIKNMFTSLWNKEKAKITTKGVTPRTLKAWARKAVKYLESGFKYIGLKLFFMITQIKDFLETKRKEADKTGEALELNSLLNDVGEFALHVWEKHPPTP